MIELIGVRFKKNGKVYSFSPNGLTLQKRRMVQNAEKWQLPTSR